TDGSAGIKSYGGIGPATSGSGVEGIGGYGASGINGAPGGDFTGGTGGDGADGGDGVIGSGGTGSTGHIGGIGGTFHGGTGTPGAPGIESFGGDGVSGENGGPGITSIGGQGTGNLGIGVMGYGADGLSGDQGSAGGYFEGGQGVSGFGGAGGNGVIGFGADGLSGDFGATGGYFQGGQGISDIVGFAQGVGIVSLGANGLTGDFGAAGGYFQGGDSTVEGGYGIYCRAGSGGTSYAGYFEGDVFVTGTINKGALGFKIDHPSAPSSKYLNHSGVESSEMKNIYDGIAVLDEAGSAWVELPSWFETLNKDFRYQLTAIGLPEPNLHIARKIEANRFQIAGGHSGTEISWTVTGVRQDPYALAHPIEVEEEKPENEQGFFLHPELYDQPLEKSISKMGMAIRRQEKINLHKPQKSGREKAIENVQQQIKLESDRNADLKARLKIYKEKIENLRLKKRP
ncbi:MAG TPA: hypothetical protein VHR47_03270, partial [Bacillota bacterium]|nr:hypothetical protein [Bacillota bacterium]